MRRRPHMFIAGPASAELPHAQLLFPCPCTSLDVEQMCRPAHAARNACMSQLPPLWQDASGQTRLLAPSRPAVVAAVETGVLASSLRLLPCRMLAAAQLEAPQLLDCACCQRRLRPQCQQQASLSAATAGAGGEFVHLPPRRQAPFCISKRCVPWAAHAHGLLLMRGYAGKWARRNKGQCATGRVRCANRANERVLTRGETIGRQLNARWPGIMFV